MTNVTHNSFLCIIYIFNSVHVSTHRSHQQERQIVSIQPLVSVTLCRWSCRVQVGSSLPTWTRHTFGNCTRHGHRHRV